MSENGRAADRYVKANLQAIEGRISSACLRAGRRREEVTLVAVTKTVPPGAIRQAYACGIRHFGENRVQETEGKLPLLGPIASEATWHMLGHLQSNKVTRALGLFHRIDAVDSLKLARTIDSHAGKKVPVLLEVNVSGELSKQGLAVDEVPAVAGEIRLMDNIDLKGLMTIAPLAQDPEDVRPVFRRLRELRDLMGLTELSMGMSHDFEVAIEEGATMIRIGRAVFGERDK